MLFTLQAKHIGGDNYVVYTGNKRLFGIGARLTVTQYLGAAERGWEWQQSHHRAPRASLLKVGTRFRGFLRIAKKTAARSAAGFWATLWGKPCAIFGTKKLTGSGQVTELWSWCIIFYVFWLKLFTMGGGGRILLQIGSFPVTLQLNGGYLMK